MKTRRPGITVIAFTTKDLMGFSSIEDEDEALSVLFVVGSATGEVDRHHWEVSTGEYDLLVRLDLFCSGDTLGEGTTVPLSGWVTGKGVREILPEGWRLSSLKLLGDTARMKSSILLVYLYNLSWALLPRIPSERLIISILRELEYFPWHDVWLSRRV